MEFLEAFLQLWGATSVLILILWAYAWKSPRRYGFKLTEIIISLFLGPIGALTMATIIGELNQCVKEGFSIRQSVV
jgi:hypothetical protein